MATEYEPLLAAEEAEGNGVSINVNAPSSKGKLHGVVSQHNVESGTSNGGGDGGNGGDDSDPEPGAALLYGGGQQLKCVLLILSKSMADSPITTFLTIYFLNLNVRVDRIGILQSLKPLVTIVGMPMLAGLMERYWQPKPAFLTATMIAAGGWIGLMYVHTFWSWLLIIATSFFILSVTNPIVDATILKSLNHRSNYGKLRLGSSIGFGGGALLAGVLTDHFGNDVLLYSSSILCGLVCCVAFVTKMGRNSNKPIEQATMTREGALEAEAMQTKAPPFKAVFSRFDVWMFLTWAILAGASKGCSDVFLFYFLKKELGASGTMLGLTLVCAIVVEVPMFFISGTLIDKFGHITLLSAGMLIYAARFALMSFLENPWLALPLELLHGLTFSITWSCIATYADTVTPDPALRATMQGVFGGAHWGIGIASGTIAGGYGYSVYGGRWTFRGAAVLVTGLSAIVWIAMQLYESFQPIKPQRKLTEFSANGKHRRQAKQRAHDSDDDVLEFPASS
eukprot:m.41319 g.41319  ORF g.41319 m.41319 type:complete len:509 (+) comp11448_c1_seq2:127-1653(+)